MQSTPPERRLTVNFSHAADKAALVALAELDGRSVSDYSARVLIAHVRDVPPTLLAETTEGKTIVSDAAKAAMQKAKPGDYPTRKGVASGAGKSGGRDKKA